ncbi:hypothetical protein BT69DRAFT_1373443 [Atractiella rhizophila]|nr:hypothetical protein BT69DRAFT_1373443 [Atractiella rhizophila]
MSDSELEDLPVFDFPEDAESRSKVKTKKVATNVKNWAKNKFKALKLMKKTSSRIPRPVISSSRHLKHGRYPTEVEEAIAQQKLELRMKPPVYHEFTVHDYHESKAFHRIIKKRRTAGGTLLREQLVISSQISSVANGRLKKAKGIQYKCQSKTNPQYLV